VDTDAEHADGAEPAVREITVNQAVAWNIAWLRKAAGLTQTQLENLVGWPRKRVSEAERSFAGSRVVEFTAQDLAALAVALGVPVAALLMPPAGGEHAFRDGAGRLHGMRELLRLAVPDNDDDTPVMGAYRERWDAAARRWLSDDPAWLKLAARWVGNTAGRRAEIAARLRGRQESLELAAAELGEFAERIERGDR
jgi:transcriptional regulator with XRE-family HTH domain